MVIVIKPKWLSKLIHFLKGGKMRYTKNEKAWFSYFTGQFCYTMSSLEILILPRKNT